MARGEASPPNIVLIGFMGSGKSEVGKRLAALTKRVLIDVDAVVESEGSSIADIFASEGEPGFRRRERAAIRDASRKTNAIIATGGGAVLDPANVKALKRSGVLVYLRTGTDELVRRLAGQRDRPLLAGKDLRSRISGMLSDRAPLYEAAADHIVSGDGRRPDAIASEIARRIGGAGVSQVRRVRVPVAASYTVFVGRNILGRVPELVGIPRSAEKVCLVSHPRVRRHWGPSLERGFRSADLESTWWTFPEGEGSKSLEMAGKLTRALAAAGLHRGDLVVALGGGVVGDLAGFAASTYARGIGVVQVPTTLLAMVDSAIGGKTGVNLSQGKNLVGTFHQPLGVVADVDVLGTLAEREFRTGLAEVVKYAFIADPGIADIVVRQREEIFALGPALDALIARCARVKAGVVAADEREAGVRAILNYGHTLGHAIEALSVARRTQRSAPLHHGEAISIGMVYAAAVSSLLGVGPVDLVADHRRVLESVGLPTRVEGMVWKDLSKRMSMDKKYAKGQRLVILRGVGAPVVREVPPSVLRAAFAEVSG